MADSRVQIIESRPGFVHASWEGPTRYEDGYTVRVGWDGEHWRATLDGLKAVEGRAASVSLTSTCAMGHGSSKEAALCDLACALAATIDALTDAGAPSSGAEA